MQKEHLELSQADHDYLRAMTIKGQVAARTFTRATALPELHRGQTLRAVAESLHVTRQSVAQ